MRAFDRLEACVEARAEAARRHVDVVTESIGGITPKRRR
jgi:hypothetical protein